MQSKACLLVMAVFLGTLSALAQGTIDFSNYKPPVVNAPILDTAGQPLGSNHFVQAYVVSPSGTFAVSGEPVRLLNWPGTDSGSGYFQSGLAVEIPGGGPSAIVQIELRAWPSHAGSSYEQALSNGASVGRSSPITVTCGGGIFPPGKLLALQGFQLSPPSTNRYSLALNASPAAGGTIQASPLPDGDGNYAPGTTVHLTAVSAAGYSFSNWIGAVSGTASTIQLTLMSNSIVTANFVSTNQPPLSSGFSAATPYNQPLLIPYTSLLQPIYDPEGQPVHIVRVGDVPLLFNGMPWGTAQLSTNAALVIADGARATYIPNQDYAGADRFSYDVADGFGGTNTVHAQIAVLPPGVQPNAARALETGTSGEVSFSFAGLPGRTYEVQRAPAATGPWEKVGELIIQPDGNGVYVDPSPLTGSGFYRTLLLP